MNNDAEVKTVGPSKAETEQANIAAEQWDFYKSNFLPYEQQYVDSTLRTLDPDNTRSLRRADVAGKVAQDADVVGRGLTEKLNTSGATPGSGRFAMGTGAVERGRALTTAGGLSALDEAMDERETRGLINLSGRGLSVANSAISTLNTVGQSETSSMLEEQRAEVMNEENARRINAGLIGAGFGAYGAYQDGEEMDQRWQGYNDRIMGDLSGSWVRRADGTMVNTKGVGVS
jgi:hypothetical protein